ncbi:HAD-IB family hydrolase [Chromohalobacter sp. 296-RDG]|uniref:HAD family hydrolase n=1 Tax=Chromohalobacter sp. 296-RDG TaxID=2994062 RepID=UPI002468B16B|nr:HAD-IB family hydrolase [Chromohalobacter sp. 296-RDG]
MKNEIRFAFFDVDDTLINIKSMFDFYRFWCYEIWHRPEMHDDFEATFSRMFLEGCAREKLNSSYYRYFTGVDPQLLDRAGADWATDRLTRSNGFFVAPVVEELQRLQSEGITPVFISGSFHALLEPIARTLEVSHILATKLEVGVDGRYTGNIIPPQTIGMGKALAVQDFLQHHAASPRCCYAFGDDLSDLPMLNVVGYPVAVGAGTILAERAATENWPVIATS